jgi:hypothetical protein
VGLTPHFVYPFRGSSRTQFESLILNLCIVSSHGMVMAPSKNHAGLYCTDHARARGSSARVATLVMAQQQAGCCCGYLIVKMRSMSLASTAEVMGINWSRCCLQSIACACICVAHTPAQRLLLRDSEPLRHSHHRSFLRLPGTPHAWLSVCFPFDFALPADCAFCCGCSRCACAFCAVEAVG